jgi:hypothetical protein
MSPEKEREREQANSEKRVQDRELQVFSMFLAYSKSGIHSRKCPKIAQAANEKELLNSKIWVAVGV